ncbi:MAG: hypothetical protein R2867_01520 [Caldilineaceae bacterium]
MMHRPKGLIQSLLTFVLLLMAIPPATFLHLLWSRLMVSSW